MKVTKTAERVKQNRENVFAGSIIPLKDVKYIHLTLNRGGRTPNSTYPYTTAQRMFYQILQSALCFFVSFGTL